MDEEETNQNFVSVAIQPRSVFGLRTDVKGNIHFTAKQEVIYPVAGVLAIHDYTSNKQKFLRFTENALAQIIIISPNRKWMAVAEKYEKSWINLYEMATLKRRKTFTFPSEIPTPEVEFMSFTYDSKGIAVLSKEPDAFLTIFFMDKAETVVVGRVSNSGQKAVTAHYISCNLSDTGLVAIGGNYTLKLLSRQEKGFGGIGTISGDNKIVTSLVWISADLLIAGTNDTQLHFIEGGDPKCVYDALATDEIDLSKVKEGKDEKKMQQLKKEKPHVCCLTYFTKGFAYAIHNVLYVFEKEGSLKYTKKTVITIPIDNYPEELYKITNVAVNAQMDTVCVTTLHSQIYIGMLFVPETLTVKELKFQTLGEPLHINKIISMSVCAWKPIIMTASLDKTVRIWNFKICKVELVKKYLIDVSVVALHPSGMFAAVGFTDQLRLMQILLDDLKNTKTFNFPRCKCATFSHEGHMLACSYGDLISVVSVFTFDLIKTFEGHNGEILALEWSKNDKFLVSSGEDGAVYEWCLESGQRINECVEKGMIYKSLQLSSDQAATYVVSHIGRLREMNESEIIRELEVVAGNVPLTTMAMARSDAVMFVGSQLGHLFNIQVPFMDTGGGTVTNHRFFINSITVMKITYNDKLLVTGTEDGTLVIWTIVNNKNRIAPMDHDLGKCTDIIIPRSALIDKNQTIISLENRIAQQLAEFQYQLSQGNAFHSEQMRDIHTGYCEAIEKLKEKNESMEAQHIDQLNVITENISQMKEEHGKLIADLEADFHDKILIEYQKSTDIKLKMDDMREDYEMKLRKSAGCLQDTVEALETNFKNQLQERQDLIRELMKEIENKKQEFVEYCRQVETDNDRRMVELQLQYEKKLKEENEAMLKWRADAGVLNKRFISVSKNCDELEKEKEILREQHHKQKTTIQNHLKDIDELKKEIEDRDYTIREKEKKVNDLLKKNQELEKYKQVLNHKIEELNAQIEPREREIKEKKDLILEMEKELEGLEHNNAQFELQLSELKDKYHGKEIELKIEKDRARKIRAQVSKICGDIYHVSGFVQRPHELKDEVMKLYYRYADDKSLKQSLQLDAEVNAEFMRQRHHLEKLLETEKLKQINKKPSDQTVKLQKENKELMAEFNATKAELNDLRKKCANMESILGISGRYLPADVAREKLRKSCSDFDDMERQHQEEIANLQNIITLLQKDTK